MSDRLTLRVQAIPAARLLWAVPGFLSRLWFDFSLAVAVIVVPVLVLATPAEIADLVVTYQPELWGRIVFTFFVFVRCSRAMFTGRIL